MISIKSLALNQLEIASYNVFHHEDKRYLIYQDNKLDTVCVPVNFVAIMIVELYSSTFPNPKVTMDVLWI